MQQIYHLTFVIILLCVRVVSAQHHHLEDSRTSSYYTFIYKLTDEQAGKLYTDAEQLTDSFFTNVFDFYPTDSPYVRPLPVGHFLFVKTQAGSLHVTLKSINNLELHILNNYRDLVMVFFDSAGTELPNLDVKLKRRRIPFDHETKTYRLGKANKRGVVHVRYQGHISYFTIERKHNNGFIVRTGKKILGTFPLNHLLSPIFYVQRNVGHVISGGRLHPPGVYHRARRIFMQNYNSGYLAFNKPEYKPGDTVRLKAFITTRSGKPYNKPVSINLVEGYYRRVGKKVGRVSPYRKGAYKFELHLHDTLQLQLDKDYSVELKTNKGSYLLSGRFRYAEYELKQNRYSLRTEKQEPGKSARLFLKGVDSNDMPLYDVRAEVVLRPSNIMKFYTSQVFVPDTLWRFETKLEALMETPVTIPDSVMPAVAMKYEAIVSFLNGTNERVERKALMDFDKNRFPVSIKIENDSLLVQATEWDIQTPVVLEQYASTGRGKRNITLPHREKINPFTERYRVVYEDQNATLALEDVPDNLAILADRTKDSLFIVTDNPRNVLFRYFLFKNQRLIAKGQTTLLTVKKTASVNDEYSLSVQYTWAGKARSRNYEIPFREKHLNIKLEHEPVIYPGQNARFEVNVHDAYGKPVADADITAYAITRKFDPPGAPIVPDLSKASQKRVIINEFLRGKERGELVRRLDYTYWKKTLGLDSIAFYRFLYPEAGYFEDRVTAETAQFAPFVVGRGDVHVIHIIYVNDQPVYFKGVGIEQPYSFAIKPGIHKVALRLRNAMITFHGVKIDSAQKLTFSIDRFKLPSQCQIEDRPYELTDDELRALSRHFILIGNGNRGDQAYLRQGERYHLLQWKNYYSANRDLVGPFYPGQVTYYNKDGYNLTFPYEPFYRYEFRREYLKLKEANISKVFARSLGWPWYETPSTADRVLNAERIQRYWNTLDESQPLPFKRFPDFSAGKQGTGKLILHRANLRYDSGTLKATFILNLDRPDESYVFTGAVRNDRFNTGNYQAVLIYSNEKYVRFDSVIVKPNGTSYYDLSRYTLHDRDTFSTAVIATIKSWAGKYRYSQRERELELQNIRSIYYQSSSSRYSFSHTVTGRVTDDEGSALPGVNVVIKGTALGTVTDEAGYYSIQCPDIATLVFSFVGFMTQEVPIRSNASADVKMFADVHQLSEVVVIGFAEQKRKNLTGSVSSVLTGRVPGVARYRHDGGSLDSVALKIRGISSVPASGEPLVILDGLVVRLQDIDVSQITAIDVLKGAQATAFYGSRASNGVILVSTRPGANQEYLKAMGQAMISVPPLEEVQGTALRKNFRDYAFWKPDLKTDAQGKVVFEATFPDDITGWSTYVLGMASKRRTGQTSTVIQTYKPLMAQLAQPHFLIEGDKATALGKITNYKQEPVRLQRSVRVNDMEVHNGTVIVRNSSVDSIKLETHKHDSITVEYVIQVENYKDGELRRIPVYPRGTMEATGQFFILPADTTFTINDFSQYGNTRIYAHADAIDVLLDEIEFLKKYPHECNEQLASRLRALLLEKKIKQYKGQKFNDEREVYNVVRKLASNQIHNGGWSWWKSGNAEIWITLHVAQSLLLAQKDGYRTPFDYQALLNYLQRELANLPFSAKARVLEFLMEIRQPVSVDDIVQGIRKSPAATLHERILAERLAQLAGDKVDWEWVHSKRSETIKGNYYWIDEHDNLQNNSVLNTLLVYQLAENGKRDSRELLRIRNYFLEQRQKTWRNTYEASLIVETILPAIIAEKPRMGKASLQFSGSVSKVVQKFPFSFDAGNISHLSVTKTGQTPVYLTLYNERWNGQPLPSGKDFSIRTFFADSAIDLIAGKPITLQVEVEVKDDVEYVMIEVPIPAGCSYNRRVQSATAGEVHREYYHHKTNIFCRSMKRGVYSYFIDLLPRYSGTYTLNPAVVECMYFPVLYGREGMKVVEIR